MKALAIRHEGDIGSEVRLGEKTICQWSGRGHEIAAIEIAEAINDALARVREEGYQRGYKEGGKACFVLAEPR
jgi:hypothetical protein